MIIDQIKALLAKIENRTEKKPAWQPFRRETRQKRYRVMERQNHSKKGSKRRRQMAARSNRINRDRVKHWKY
jgi:hypothetical protein